MKKLLLSIALLVPCHGRELSLDVLKDALAKHVDAFDPVEMTADGKSATFDIKLGDTPAKVQDDLYGGFRFRCPKLPEGTDFVWYFNAPANWGNWYIVPAEGKANRAFKGWLNGDKIYEPFDKAADKGRLRVLQTLDGGYFKEGTEYLVWFRKTKDGTDNNLRGIAGFAKKGTAWDYDDIEKALALKIAPPEAQVEAMSSMGGKILLDKEFFDRGYAEARIDSMFFSIRHTKPMGGGFFSTIQVAIPPCGTGPSFAAIVKKYGSPDFTRNGIEEAKVRDQSGGTPVDDDDKKVTKHYYDHFAFEVESGAKNPKVLRVITYGCDFAKVRPPVQGSAFARIGIENLTVFHKDGKEVGRAYYFLDGPKKPIFITMPPTGEYRADDEMLIAKGGGVWIWESRFPDGKVARRLPMKANRMEGKAEGFHANGKPSFTAEYHNGNLNGEVVQFDETGKQTSLDKFKNGEPEK